MTGRLMLRTLAIGAVALGLLSGCATDSPDMTVAAGKQLQAAVAAVSQAAAGGDIATAITNLDALERRLREATASGNISADRSAKIDASISLVRADLTAALPPPPPPSPTPTPTVTVQIPAPGGNTGSDNSDDNGKDKGGGKDAGPGGKGGK
ncbi:hypothetical protein GCM10027052_16070 [Parafrigoribacterium mesophilum]|uniref:hypothetical protein n=1 Tax=Parafrigoribacterium mesophilum TaxID=433646 RepID=UPI0031FDCF8E